MRRAVIFLLGALFFTSPAMAVSEKEVWAEFKGEHFIIYYDPSLPNSYIREFASKCEGYYRVITDRLGLARFDFWLWEERAVIGIYKSREEYLDGTNRPEWSGASVDVRKKRINTFYFDRDFFDNILPHELSHIILREFIGFNRAVPLWFEEGVACSNEKGSYIKYLLLAKGFFDKGVYLPMPQLDNIDERSMRIPSLFYATSASAVIFLAEECGKKDFIAFLRELRDGMNFYLALRKAYGFEDIGDLDTRFQAFLKELTYEDITKRRSLYSDQV